MSELSTTPEDRPEVLDPANADAVGEDSQQEEERPVPEKAGQRVDDQPLR